MTNICKPKRYGLRPLDEPQGGLTQKIGKKDLVRRTICQRIVAGLYRKGERVPSCRDMSRQLKVSKNSAFEAYSALVELGILESRNRSGFRVGMTTPCLDEQGFEGQGASAVSAQIAPLVARLPSKDSILPLSSAGFAFPFLYNQIDAELFPIEAWRECSRLALGRSALPIWVSEAVENDSPDLVFQIRQRLLHYRGIRTERDEILITVGAQHALCLLSTLFAPDDRPVAFENPGYHEARHLFRLYGNKIAPVGVDQDGLNPDDLPGAFKLAYVTPGCQFPSMAVLSDARRATLFHKARNADAFIIEDDYESGLLVQGNPSPALKGCDENGRVIYVGSLSKTLSPSIRMGFIVAPFGLIAALKTIRRLTVRHPPSVVQETTALFMAHGYYDSHVKKLGKVYCERWHIMHDALRKYCPELLPRSLGQAVPRGTSFWLTGPYDGFDAQILATALQQRGVLIEPGHIFGLGRTGRQSFRIGFASIATEKIEQGVQLIAEEIHQLFRC